MKNLSRTDENGWIVFNTLDFFRFHLLPRLRVIIPNTLRPLLDIFLVTHQILHREEDRRSLPVFGLCPLYKTNKTPTSALWICQREGEARYDTLLFCFTSG